MTHLEIQHRHSRHDRSCIKMKISKSDGDISHSDLIDTLTTTKKVADYFRLKGKNIIPIVAGTKVPPKGFSLEQCFTKICDYPITENDSIAMLHGKISNTFAIDVDLKNGSWEDAVHIVAKDIEKILSRTIVIKTPKKGCHFIVEPLGELPPKNAKYFNKEGVEIDIKTEGGYTLLPTSTYTEKHLGKYQFISETLNTDPTDWLKFEAHIAKKGFFLKDDINDENLKSDYDLDKLLRGKFVRGTRRKSLNSLYCKLRIRRFSATHCKKKILEINQKCAEPLAEKEIDYNLEYAESFFNHHIKAALETKSTKPDSFSAYAGAAQLMEEYHFISHQSKEIYYYANGIYRRNGSLLIAKKCRQYWESLDIDTAMITEITNIIRDKTMLLTEDDNEEIFNLDYKKIILKNGMYDFDTNSFVQYDENVLSTIKHPIYYDSTKTCPKFEKFLHSCFDGDEKRITQVWEMMALCIIKKYIIQKGYVNYGIGSNGKSTYLNILRNMLGLSNTTSIPMQSFQKSQFVGFELRGKCANLSADGGTEPITKTGFIKQVLGGDAVRCEQKFKDSFMFLPFITLIFTFNELPTVTDASDGFARKIQTIHWDKRFYKNNRDYTVDNIATDSNERSGIFNKLIPIINNLLKTRILTFESTVDDTKAVWLSRSDSFYRFKKEHIIFGMDYKITTNHIESAYSQFCEEERMTPIKKSDFYTELKNLAGHPPTPTRFEGRSVRVWHGITIRSQLSEAQQNTL